MQGLPQAFLVPNQVSEQREASVLCITYRLSATAMIVPGVPYSLYCLQVVGCFSDLGDPSNSEINSAGISSQGRDVLSAAQVSARTEGVFPDRSFECASRQMV